MRLARNSCGADIGRLQQVLLERGLDIPQKELDLRMFGPGTELVVKAFQQANVDSAGRALTVDGVVGKKTWDALLRKDPPGSWLAPGWHCELVRIPHPANGVVAAAIGDIGKHEDPDGSNQGPQIKKFFPPGISRAPWCAFAVSTWLEAAHGGSPFPYRIGSVLGIVEWARKRNRIIDFSDPQPGDLWCALRGDGHGHVELIVHRFPTGKLALIGGNVRNAVRGTTRMAGSWTHIVRPLP